MSGMHTILRMIAKGAAVAAGLVVCTVQPWTAAGGRTSGSQPTACRLSQLRIQSGPSVTPKTGQNPLSFVLTNRANTTCTLRGYPTVELLDRRGKRLPFVITHRGDQMVTSRPPTRAFVRAGGTAFVVINKYRCDVRSFDVARTLRLGLPGQRRMARQIRLGRVASFAYCGNGDPGSIVAVSPFEPSLAATASHG